LVDASRLARVSGAMDYLRGGLVAYATDTKTDVLGVAADVLDKHGPCSPPTAEAMATRAREVFAADLGIGVVCVAGPTSQAGVEVGTTVWALATPDGVRSWSRVLPGDRDAVTERASTAALEAVRRHLLDALR
jgi:PncC family amidohydrolase